MLSLSKSQNLRHISHLSQDKENTRQESWQVDFSNNASCYGS